MAKTGDSDSSEENDGLWFVLECDEDCSVVLIPQRKVILNDTVQAKIGTVVNFSMNEKVYAGNVRHFSSDYEAMLIKQEEVRKEGRPHEKSFHADQPRGTALKAANKWAALMPSSQKQKPRKDGSNGHVDKPQLSDMMKDTENKAGDNSSGSEELEITPEVQQYLDKMAKKKRKKDMRVLQALNHDKDMQESGDHEDSRNKEVQMKRKTTDEIKQKKKTEEDIKQKKKTEEDIKQKKKTEEDIKQKKKTEEDISQKKKTDEEMMQKKKMRKRQSRRKRLMKGPKRKILSMSRLKRSKRKKLTRVMKQKHRSLYENL